MDEKKQVLIVDDISDSGNTMLSIKDIGTYKTVSLYIKNGTKFIPNIYCHKCDDDIWVQFPWETKESLAKKDNTFENVKTGS